ncbi:MAG: hypothetical protein HQM10_21925 [Candidatus Riflebacteria bacterium]|nr:hypothetical protein [Candidatus Riflebacteria bacterium]
MKKYLSIFVFLGIFLSGLSFSGLPAYAADDELSPEAKKAIEESVNLLSKIMEKAILQSTTKALELLPEADKKTEQELDEIMNKEVREITLKALQEDKFADAVVEAVSRSAEDAFRKAIQEATKETEKAK